MLDLNKLKLVVENADGWNECPTPADDEAVAHVRDYIEREEQAFQANLEYMAMVEARTKS